MIIQTHRVPYSPLGDAAENPRIFKHCLIPRDNT